MNKIANAGMIDYWNSDAGRKWVRFQQVMDLSLLPYGSRAMDASGVGLGERVIDVGCGCGDTTFELARRIGPAGHVLGVDVSKPALTQARYRAGYKAEGNYKFAHGDAQTHAFDDGAYDLVFSRFGGTFFDDPVAAFGNFSTALKPEGRLALVCWRPVDDNEWVHLPLTAAADHMTVPELSEPGAPGPFSFGDPDRIKQVLGDAGFADIMIEPFNQPFAVDMNAKEAAEFMMQIGPVGWAIAQVNPDQNTRTRLMDDLRGRLASYNTGQGIALGAATWIVTAHKA